MSVQNIVFCWKVFPVSFETPDFLSRTSSGDNTHAFQRENQSFHLEQNPDFQENDIQRVGDSEILLQSLPIRGETIWII